jgi:acyl-CoA thioesterase I
MKFSFIFAAISFLALPLLAAEKPRPQTIVFFGDSLTSGYGLDLQETYPALLQDKIRERGWNFRTVNAGVSGETSAGGLRRINWIMRQPIDVFVLELGANDGLRGLSTDATRNNLQGIIDRVTDRFPDSHIVIAGMQVPPNMGAAYATDFAAIFPGLAKENNALLIPFLLEGVGGIPELNLPDGVHPTAEGHQIMAKTVWETLEPLLREMHRQTTATASIGPGR